MEGRDRLQLIRTHSSSFQSGGDGGEGGGGENASKGTGGSRTGEERTRVRINLS